MSLLFPFGLTADQMTFWGFVAVVVTVFLSLWSSIASTIAARYAKYAKDAPTKADLQRVEDHVAATSEHLRRQARREELNTQAERIHVSIRGRSPQDEDLVATVEVHNPIAGLRLTCIDFLGKTGTPYGSTQTTQVGASTYEAWLDRRNVQRWYASERPGEFNLRIRVHMVIDGEEGHKEMPVTVSDGQIQVDAQSPQIKRCWLIEGEV